MTDYDDSYMRDPSSKSIKGFIEALSIFSKYTAKGVDESFFCGAEHDLLYIYVDINKLLPESEDGKRLRELGFHAEDDGWGYFT